MAEEHATERTPVPVCRWRTSTDPVDVIEALERIEAVLATVEDRVRRLEAALPAADTPPIHHSPRPIDVQSGT